MSKGNLSKEQWLSAYETRVMKRAKKRPDWQHLPAGHMYHSMKGM